MRDDYDLALLRHLYEPHPEAMQAGFSEIAKQAPIYIERPIAPAITPTPAAEPGAFDTYLHVFYVALFAGCGVFALALFTGDHTILGKIEAVLLTVAALCSCKLASDALPVGEDDADNDELPNQGVSEYDQHLLDGDIY